MRKINIPLRFKNRVTLFAILALVVRIVIEVLTWFSITPPVSYDTFMNTVKMVLDVLVLAGVITDPTTPGIGDSDRALEYNKLGGIDE